MSQPENLTLGDVADILPDPFVVVDKDGSILFLNARARSALLEGDTATDNVKDLFGEPTEAVERFLTMCSRNLQPVPGKFSIQREDGSIDEYLIRGGRVRRGDVDAIGLNFHDKSKAGENERFRVLNETIDRLRLEIKARKHVEAVLEAEKQTLACVISGQPLPVAMKLLAEALEKQADGLLVSILLLEDGTRLRHAAAPSLPDHYTNAIDGLEIGPDVGSCGTAAFTRLTTIAVDIMQDPRWEPFRDLAESANVRACWSTPIISSGGDVLGTLAMYYRVPRAPSDDELRLIANSAYVAGIVIEKYRSQEALAELLERERQLRERAEFENNAKDEFLAMLGHELRNPLSAIANAAFALEAKNDADDAVRKLYKIVVNETTLLKRILDDLLDISRLSQGKLKLRREPVALDKFVDELETAMRSAYPERPVQFEIRGEPGVVHADASRLRQSVQNLLDNAIKYSVQGDEVRFRLDAADDRILIQVSDTGQGIEPELLSTIFEPFVQADRSIERTASGLGLGLALVKRFTEMHGGEIDVASGGPGCGSTFTLTLPRSEAEVAAVDVEPALLSANVTRGPCKILVVEDNTNARDGLCELLKLWGHKVYAAADGKEALDVFRSERPQVALVDIGLPLIDGYEVATAVRKESGNGDIKLVALTGYGQESDRKRAIDAGFDTHIVKPAHIKDLIAVLGEPDGATSAPRA